MVNVVNMQNSSERSMIGGTFIILVAFIVVNVLISICGDMESSCGMALSNVTVAAWNMRCSFSSAAVYLSDLMRTSDVVALSEHALYPCEHHKLADLNPNYSFVVKSYDNLNDVNFGSRRGQGGCAIGWSKSISNIVKPLHSIDCDRICGIQMKLNNNTMYVVAVYMPQPTCVVADYTQVLLKLENIIGELMSSGEVMIIGDINGHLGPEYGCRGWGKSSKNGKIFMNMVEKYNMLAIDMGYKCTGPTYTFSSARGKSYIDHCIVSRLLNDCVRCEVIEDSIHNISDHLAIRALCNLGVPTVKGNTLNRHQVAWHKVSPNQIQELYTSPLEEQIITLIRSCNLNNNRLGPDYDRSMNIENNE